MDGQNIEIERSKHIQEYLKHLTTLSTGAIVLLVALWDKVGSSAEWLFLVRIAVAAFFLSILGAVASMTINMVQFTGMKKQTPRREKVVGGFGLCVCWICFLAAVCALSIFVCRNFG